MTSEFLPFSVKYDDVEDVVEAIAGPLDGKNVGLASLACAVVLVRLMAPEDLSVEAEIPLVEAIMEYAGALLAAEGLD